MKAARPRESGGLRIVSSSQPVESHEGDSQSLSKTHERRKRKIGAVVQPPVSAKSLSRRSNVTTNTP